jgi:hypothetical protein
MSGWLGILTLALTLLAALGGEAAEAQERVTVTVQQLLNQAHRIEVAEGAEVLWADPHFDRVWFPAGAESPKVERVSGGFRAVFTKAGTYRGAFTVVAGHRTEEVYNLIVVVKPQAQ